MKIDKELFLEWKARHSDSAAQGYWNGNDREVVTGKERGRGWDDQCHCATRILRRRLRELSTSLCSSVGTRCAQDAFGTFAQQRPTGIRTGCASEMPHVSRGEGRVQRGSRAENSL